MKTCPCGSNNTLENCCALVHEDVQLANQAEQIMRARYTAFVLKNIDFLINTYHTSCNADNEREQIREAAKLDWVKLEVIESKQPTEQSEYAFVEFKAWYMEKNELHVLHERSRFTKEEINNKISWRYLDGIYPEAKQQSKTGRNDPCPCNSGKKFKKCCA